MGRLRGGRLERIRRPGIPPRDLVRIFERFYKVDRSRGTRVPGSGLGLSIARALVVDAYSGSRYLWHPMLVLCTTGLRTVSAFLL